MKNIEKKGKTVFLKLVIAYTEKGKSPNKSNIQNEFKQWRKNYPTAGVSEEHTGK